jgi:hypothetical protein
MAHQDGKLYQTIRGLTVQKYDFKAKAKALQNSTNELADQCEKRVAECQSVVTQLLGSYDEIIKEANAEAVKIKVEATKEATSIVNTAQEETKAWNAEKARLAHIQEFKSQIKLSIGGVKMVSSMTTMRRFPDSMIGAMFSGRHPLHLDDEGYFFIDRDGTHFRHILNFLRQPEEFSVDLPEGQLKELKKECAYYGLLEVMFPWTPAAPVTAISRYGHNIVVTQDQKGLWYGNKAVLKVCRSCFATEGGNYQYSILTFTTAPTVRELTDAQPQPATCQNCNAVAKK